MQVTCMQYVGVQACRMRRCWWLELATELTDAANLLYGSGSFLAQVVPLRLPGSNHNSQIGR